MPQNESFAARYVEYGDYFLWKQIIYLLEDLFRYKVINKINFFLISWRSQIIFEGPNINNQ